VAIGKARHRMALKRGINVTRHIVAAAGKMHGSSERSVMAARISMAATKRRKLRGDETAKISGKRKWLNIINVSK